MLGGCMLERPLRTAHQKAGESVAGMRDRPAQSTRQTSSSFSMILSTSSWMLPASGLAPASVEAAAAGWAGPPAAGLAGAAFWSTAPAAAAALALGDGWGAPLAACGA